MKEDLNKWRNLACSWIWRLKSKDAKSSQRIYRSNATPIKILAWLLVEISKLFLNFIWKGTGPRIVLTICFFKNIYLFIWLYRILIGACRIFDFHCGMLTLSCGMWNLVFWPGIEPGPPALGARSLSHWTTREVAVLTILIKKNTVLWL